MKKILYISLIIVILISVNLTVYAKSVNQLNSQINQAEGELSEVQKEKSAALKEVEKLTNQIAELEDQITELDFKIDTLTIEIDNKQKDIEAKQKEYEERQELLNKRLVAVYTSGKTTYLDVLLSSSSLTDFISNYYLIEQLSDADANLLNQINNLKTQIENEKAELEANKVEIEESKSTIENNKNTLEVAKSEKSSRVASLNAEEKKIQAEIDEFESDRRAMLAEAANDAKVAYSANSSYYVDPSSGSSSISGFICSVTGRSKSDITCGFYGYSGHGGADFARNSKGAVEGLPVVAAKAGVVTTSMAKKNSSGNYTSYGEYIKINHQDGTSTLYAHMQPGSRTVSVGEYVSQGQQIGNVGRTGHVTGPHLHFEIIVSGVRVDPARYLP